LKKLLTASGVLAALLLLLVALLSLPREERSGPPRLASSCSHEGGLLGGAASVPLVFSGPVPIGGFPRLRWTAEGTRDPLAVRALVLGGPGGCAVGFVSAEILLVPGALARAVEERSRDLGLSLLVVGATHTHAGPGGYWDSFLGGRIATGPYDPAVFERLADTMARSLHQAAAARRPVEVEAGLVDARPLARNRAGGAIDGRLVALRIRSGGAVVGELAALGAHATMLGSKNRRLSGDWPGLLMKLRPAPLVFFQGALGDQSVAGSESARPGEYASAVSALLDGTSWQPIAPRLALARAAVPLPHPWPGGAPRLLRTAAGRLFGGAMPSEAAVTAVRLGSLLLLAVPAEPVEEVARTWRRAAGPGAEVLALAGDYDGYVETPERMARGEGETVRTYYGPELAARLGAAVRLAAEATGTPAR